MSRTSRLVQHFTPATVAVLLAAALSGCAGPSGLPGLTTQALNLPPPRPPLGTVDQAEKANPEGAKAARAALADTAVIADARANPGNADAALRAARLLRGKNDRAGALKLLDTAAAVHDTDTRIAREQGMLALELGALPTAERHLRRAMAHGGADWQTHSALGVALSGAGKHQAAQTEFAKALRLAPDHPTILNNLALSYMLDGKREQAARMLQLAAQRGGADGRVKGNLAIAQKLATKRDGTSPAKAKKAASKAQPLPTRVADAGAASVERSALPPPRLLGADVRR